MIPSTLSLNILDLIGRDLAEFASSKEGWPSVGDEPIDLENCSVHSVTVFAGGDWQQPMLITIDPESGRILHSEKYKP